MIDKLYSALIAAGVDVGPEEVAEILWLATRTINAESSEPNVPRRVPEYSNSTLPIPVPEITRENGTAAEVRRYFNTDAEAKTPHASQSPAGGLVLVQRAPALDNPLEIMRALRPLGRRALTNGGVTELDEEQTVTTSVEQRMMVPVFKPQKGHWLDLALIIDTHHSMLLWNDLVDELRRALTLTGVFRDVRVWYLSHGDGQEAHTVSRTTRGEPRPPQEVSDPAGHQLVLIVSDTVASRWKSQSLASIMRQWASHGPLAILNVLAPRLWTRCAVHPIGGLVRPGYPAAPNTSWRLTPPQGKRRRSENWSRFFDKVAIPVLEISPKGIAALATIVAGSGEWNHVPCLILERDISATEQGAAVNSPNQAVSDPVSTFRNFQENSSPAAQELAGYLSAVPLTLPVMTLVRRVMMPRSEHSHLAEVALGGLFESWAGIQSAADIDRFEFQFLPGVREALLGAQLREDVTAVQEIVRRQVADFIERSAAVRTFQAVKVTSNAVKDLYVKEGAIPFAETDRTSETDTIGRLAGIQADVSSSVANDDEQSARVVAGRFRLDQLLSSGVREKKWQAWDQEARRLVSVSEFQSLGQGSDRGASNWAEKYRQAHRAEPQHLVSLYHVGSEYESLYVATEEPTGLSLQDYMQEQGKLGVGFTEALAFQIDSALSALHGSGLAHGDLKPENIVIGPTGIAKVKSSFSSTWSTQSISQYSPPEAGKVPPNRNSDLFSLGCILFASLAGSAPYSAGFSALEEMPSSVSRMLRRTILGLTALDPATRDSGARSLSKLKSDLLRRAETSGADLDEASSSSYAPIQGFRPYVPSEDERHTSSPSDDGDPQLLRPYAMTGGRTRSRYDLSIESLVTTTADQEHLVGLLPEHSRICRLCVESKSVAEVSALLSIPLGVARILVADLAEAGLVSVNDPNSRKRGKQEQIHLLGELRDGLEDL